MSSLIERVNGAYTKPAPAVHHKLQALPLRTYQAEGLDALTGESRELIALPTGGGKTVMFAHKAIRHVAAHPGERVLILVHTDELVSQAHKKVLDVAPGADAGIVKAARNEVGARIIVASVQTLRSLKRREQIRNVGLIVIDEAHHAVATTYKTIMEHFGCFARRCLTVGFTATPTRGDGKSLYPIWERVAFSREISWMVRKRFLIPPRGKAVEVPDLDLRKVKSTRADFKDGELGTALAESLAPELIAAAYAEHAAGRKGILFAPTVASAEVFAEALSDQGIKAEVIHGSMPMEERKAVLERHRAGTTQVLCNCMILTEGYDDPSVSCIVMARPTKSKGLYIQCVGRGLRVDPEVDYEGQDCLILDVVGASANMDLRCIADLSERKIDPDKARDGKTLIELEDEFDAGEGIGPDAPTFYSGEVVVRDFDPLAKSSSKVWIKSNGGSYFVPAGKHGYVFICEWPRRGEWSVAWAGAYPATRLEPDVEGTPRVVQSGGRNVGMTGHRALPLDQAMVWAEDLAVDMGADTMNLANKRASWRRGEPSEKTRVLARNLGIDPDGKRAGEVSDLIGKIMGSHRIDPLVAAIQRKAG